ncbi:hypothetical protein OPQ81_000467 [Rhizoctonia solani]|nr:hypothetical protein OPQ81_000467 [Rhizoctonia solani]
MYGNYFVDITDHALDAHFGSYFLLGGNYFNRFAQPWIPGHSGIVFRPNAATMKCRCRATLGLDCASNTLLESGQLEGAANAGAIGHFKNNAVKSARVIDPSRFRAYVQTNARTGKIT